MFAEAKLDTVVLEVGLGGRLDATNVVTPELCVITPIDYDHQIFLGDTIEQIAAEKAGILKPGVPAVFAEQRPEAEAVLRAQAQGAVHALARLADHRSCDRCARQPLSPARRRNCCPLAGEHQVENARVAAIALARARRFARGHCLDATGRHAWSWSPNSPRSSLTARTIPPGRAPGRLHSPVLFGTPHLDRLWRAARQGRR